MSQQRWEEDDKVFDIITKAPGKVRRRRSFHGEWVYEFEPNAAVTYERGAVVRPLLDRFGDWLADDSPLTHTSAVLGGRPMGRPEVLPEEPSVRVDLPGFPGATRVTQAADGAFRCRHALPEAFVHGVNVQQGVTGHGTTPEAALNECVSMVKDALKQR